jgi:translation initiation factor 2 beta subunit (eIF-2beta)/eIF-5
MTKINVSGLTEITDIFYRYKMDKITVVYEKNKTVLLNIEQIAKDLNRDVGQIIKFLKKSIGSNINNKKGKIIIAKVVTCDELQNYLKTYIEYCVICPECHLPETHFSIESGLFMDCDCCGNKQKINVSKIPSKPIQAILSNFLYKTKKSKKKKRKN